MDSTANIEAGEYVLAVCYVGPNAKFPVKVVAASDYAAQDGSFSVLSDTLVIDEQFGPMPVEGSPRAGEAYGMFRAEVRRDLKDVEDIVMYYADASTGEAISGTRRAMQALSLVSGVGNERYAVMSAPGEAARPTIIPVTPFAVYLEFTVGSNVVTRALPKRFAPTHVQVDFVGYPLQNVKPGDSFEMMFVASHSYDTCTNLQPDFTMLTGASGFQLSNATNSTVRFGVPPGTVIPVSVDVVAVFPSNTTKGVLVASAARLENGAVDANTGKSMAYMLATGGNSTCAGTPQCFGRGICDEAAGACRCLAGFSGAVCEVDESSALSGVTPPALSGDMEDLPEEPSEEPTEEPTEEPREEASEEPSKEHTFEPTEGPSEEPCEELTEVPTDEQLEEPSEDPSEEPSEEPISGSTHEPADEDISEPCEEDQTDPEVVTEPPREYYSTSSEDQAKEPTENLFPVEHMNPLSLKV